MFGSNTECCLQFTNKPQRPLAEFCTITNGNFAVKGGERKKKTMGAWTLEVGGPAYLPKAERQPKRKAAGLNVSSMNRFLVPCVGFVQF